MTAEATKDDDDVSLSILTAIFPGEPGLASFTEATKDDGGGGDNWSY